MHIERYGYFFGKTFRERVRVRPEGIVYKDALQIPWSNVVGYRAYPDFMFDIVYTMVGSAKPKLHIYLSDGTVLRLRGDLLEVITDDEARNLPVAPSAQSRLITRLVENDKERWSGPREEMILFLVMGMLLILGAAVSAGLSLFRQWTIPPVGAGVIGGTILAQTSFLIAPLVGRRARIIYVQATQSRIDGKETRSRPI